MPSFLVLAAAVAGCSTLSAQRVTSPAPAQPAAEPAVVLPNNELTAPLLNGLLAAEIAIQRGVLDLAASNYLRAAWETRDPRVAKRAVRVAVAARQHAIALEAAKLWIDVLPTDIEARQSMAALLIQSGDTDEALKHLEAIVAANKDTAPGFQAVIGLLSREDDKSEALALFEKLIEQRRKDPNALFAHAQMALAAGEGELALKSIDALLKKHPGWVKSWVLKSNVLRHLGRTDESVDAYEKAVEIAPDDAGLRLAYAKLLVEQRQFETARAQFRELSERLPNNPEIGYALGLLALQLDDLPTAEREFQRLVRLGQHKNEAAFALGQIAESRREFEQAMRWYDTVIEGPSFVEARLRMVFLLTRTKNVETGRAYIQELRRQFPEDQARWYYAEGELLREQQRFAEAMEAFDAGLAVAPDDAEMLYARAMVAERLDRLDQVEQDLHRILETEPDNAQALNALGYTLADRTDRYQEAHDFVRRALELRPEDPAINDSMGWILFRLQRYQEAEAFLKKAIAALDDPEIAAHLGELYWVTGRQTEARQIWDKALERSPDNPAIRQVMERLVR